MEFKKEGKDVKINWSPLGCLGLIVTIYIVFHIGDIWRLFDKIMNYLLTL